MEFEFDDVYRKLAELVGHYKAFLKKTPDIYVGREDGKPIHIMAYKEYVAERLTKQDLLSILKEFMICPSEIKVGESEECRND